MEKEKSDYIFVYSELMNDHENEINKNINQTFVCGEISIGSTRHKFSKIIRKSELQSMISVYPDTKIIYETNELNFVTYILPEYRYIKG